ncbi:MAG: sensor domain-containing protein [Methylobacter sp.]
MSIEDGKQTDSLSTVETTPAKRPSKSEVDSDNASLQDMIIGLRTVLDQTGTYIFTKDTAGRYTYINQMTQDLFGASFEDIVGKDDNHFFDLALANELRLNDRRVMDFGETIEREETNVVKTTGEKRIYWTIKKPLRNDQGQIIGLCGISIDITERKAMEHALHKSEAHLRLSQIGGGIGTWENDLVNNKQIWSENCTDLLGLSARSQSTWEDFLSIVLPEDRQKVLEAIRLHIESGTPYDVEYRAVSANGTIRCLRSAGQVERDAAGKPSIMRGIVQDITERHHNQQRIEQLLAEQKAIVENQLVGICTAQDRKIVWANSAYEAMFGYNRGELIGCSTRKLYLNEEDYQSVGKAYENIENNKIIRTQCEFVCKDGRRVWLDMSGTILHQETNELLWIFVDVTERKQAEAQKEKSLSLLYATLESTYDAILVVDLNNTWVLHNQRFLDLWQISDEILATKDDGAALSYVLTQLEDADAFLKKVIDLYATPEMSSFDILEFKNGKKIERYSIPQRIDDKVVGRVWSFRDVTERRLIELALKRESEKNLALLRNASDGICILDFDGNTIEVSDSFCDMLGYRRDEMIGMNVAQWDVTFIGSELLQVVRQQFEKPVRSQFETRHRRKDGTIYDVEVSGFPLELDGKPALFNSSRDITERKQAEMRLFDSENKYRSLIDLASDAIFIADTISGIIVDCNKNAAALLGKSKSEIIGLHQAELHPADKVSLYQKIFKSHIESGHDITEDVLVVHKDGHTIPVDIHASVVKLEGSMVILGIFRDITKHKQKTDELNRTRKRYDLATSIGKVGIWDWNCVTGDLVWNDETYRIFGLDSETSRPSYELYLNMVHEEDRKKIDNAVHESLYEKKSYGEDCRIILETGEERICHATGEVEYNEAGDPVRMLGTFQDISGQKKIEAKLEHIAYYDGLTTLPNRVLLSDRLHQAMTQAQRSGQQLAVAFLDLDGFKTINDNYGHETGDQLLITLATHMKEALREGDTLARLGGDEFVAVLLDLEDVDASVPVLTRLLDAAAQSVHVGDLVLQVSASLGVTFYPQVEDMDADQLLRQSDQAMYQAKLTGKNRYHIFDAQLNSNLRRHHKSLRRIRQALNDHEFVLYYQPKVNMRTGMVIGVEALIRWQHPEKGLLPPIVFLPEIEDHLLAIDIGEWVLDTVLSQIALWHETGLNIPVSVNVGARQLQQKDFVERLQTLLKRHPTIRPGDLELEVLETSALDDVVGVSYVIEACRKMGVSFALDDFGTGYSSLTYLRRLPVVLLKIDQSFVRDMLDDPDDLTIIDGVVSLAHAFRREVIAEGVETIEHGTMLLQLGCELAQGYGIARPMPANQLLNWSTAWQPDPAWASQSLMSRDNLPLLFACVEQRCWIAAIEGFIKGERDAPLPLDTNQSRFNLWINTESIEGLSAQLDFETINSLHRQIQALSINLCELQILGQNSEAIAKLVELHDLGDALIEQMKVTA